MFHSWTLKNRNLNSYSLENDDSLPNINFHLIKLSESCLYLWIGDYNSKLENLSCSMKTPYEHDPLGTEIMISNMDEINNIVSNVGKNLSIKLAKRLNKQVFVSFNVSNNLLEQPANLQNQSLSLSEKSNFDDKNLMQMIEQRIFQEIKKNINKF